MRLVWREYLYWSSPLKNVQQRKIVGKRAVLIEQVRRPSLLAHFIRLMVLGQLRFHRDLLRKYFGLSGCNDKNILFQSISFGRSSLEKEFPGKVKANAYVCLISLVVSGR